MHRECGKPLRLWKIVALFLFLFNITEWDRPAYSHGDEKHGPARKEATGFATG